MRIFPRIKAVICAASLTAFAASAQHIDILEGTPPTHIYVETTYDANDGRDECNWYAPASELVDSLRNSRSDFNVSCVVEIRLKGTLNRKGARRFADLIAQIAASPLRPSAIVLDSRGGDADAALAIARLIRSDDVFRRIENGVATRLDTADSTVCFSACIVVFAAGFRRSVEFNIYDDPQLPSRLGIHRPGQFDRTANRYDTSAQNREIMRIRRALKVYFEEVGVSPGLVDDMFAVPFEELRLLDETAIRAYGLLDNQA